MVLFLAELAVWEKSHGGSLAICRKKGLLILNENAILRLFLRCEQCYRSLNRGANVAFEGQQLQISLWLSSHVGSVCYVRSSWMQ